MKNSILFLCSLLSTSAFASKPGEELCLAKILYAEARGEPIEGIIAVGQASINRAKVQQTSICGITGVTRLQPLASVRKLYIKLAQMILKGLPSIIDDADSWDHGPRPDWPGKIRRIIGRHVFYRQGRANDRPTDKKA